MADETWIRTIAAEKASESGCFLVEVRIKPHKIFVTVDKMEGITIGECSVISRKIESEMEGKGILESHDLEISSPGLDQPLKVKEQFQKYIGRKITIRTADNRERTAILKNAGEGSIEIEEKIKNRVNGKKVEEELLTTLPMNEVIEVKPVISFK